MYRPAGDEPAIGQLYERKKLAVKFMLDKRM